MKNKVIVTGATGFLGFNLAKRLKEEGFEVIGLGRNIKKAQKLINLGICFKKINLEDLNEVLNITKNTDYVFHCAAKSSLWGSYKSFYNSNVLATKNIASACIQNKVKKLIYVSSPSIYFEFKDKFKIKEDENLPKKYANYYIKTKRKAEEIIDELYLKQGLKVITIRPRGIFGIEDTALLPRLIRANKKFIPRTKKEDILIDITYVDNVVESMVLAMHAGDIHNGKKYNITNNEPIYFYSTLEKIINELGLKFNCKYISYNKIIFLAKMLELIYKFIPFSEPVFTSYSIGLLSFNQTLDITKAQRDLNYKPIVSMEEGIKTIVQSYKENKIG